MNDKPGEERSDDPLDDSIPMLTEVVPQGAPAGIERHAESPAGLPHDTATPSRDDATAPSRGQASAGEPLSEALQLASDRVAGALAEELQASLQTALAPTLHALLRDALEDALRDALDTALREAVRGTLAPALQDAARIAVEGALRDAAFLDAALHTAERGATDGEAAPRQDGPGPVGAL